MAIYTFQRLMERYKSKGLAYGIINLEKAYDRVQSEIH